MPHTQSNGVELYYEVHGDGPPALFVTGVGLDHSAWAHQIPAFSREFRCIVLDNRGIGRSGSDPSVAYTVDLMAKDALAVLEAAGVGAAHVVGASLGGCVGFALALSAPHKVRTLAVHGTRHQCWPHTRLRFEVQMALNRLDPDLAAAASALAFYGGDFFNRNAARLQAEIARRAARMREGSYPVATVEQQYRAAIAYDVADRLKEVGVPVLVGVGTSDELAPPGYARAIAEAIPGAELIEFPGAPHMVNMFAPEAFNEKTLAFLRRHAGDQHGEQR